MSRKATHILAAALLATGLLGATAAVSHDQGSNLAGVICCGIH
jgi:hypothetical protein